ncbi:MAG TPA: response regulator transcription factor [Erysipelothrix sp.]|nr:response regulator transcription factor [Erysipelothrix sp.]
MTNVLIVDDQRTARHMLKTIIESSNGRYKLAYEIENAGLAELYCASNKIDLILMDVYTSSRENGIRYAQKIKASYPHIKIIIITSLPEVSFIEKAKKAQCDSFWYKDLSSKSLLDVMDRTMAGESVYPDSLPILKIGHALSSDFTKKEIEILQALIDGKTYDEVAQTLFISKSTVKYHINNILSKTGHKSSVNLLVDIAEQKFILPNF